MGAGMGDLRASSIAPPKVPLNQNLRNLLKKIAQHLS
jgi:hypothetical protein